jgi:hypothetical protein
MNQTDELEPLRRLKRRIEAAQRDDIDLPLTAPERALMRTASLAFVRACNLAGVEIESL